MWWPFGIILIFYRLVLPAVSLSPHVALQRTPDSGLVTVFLSCASSLSAPQKTQALARISRLRQEFINMNDGQIEAALDHLPDLQHENVDTATILPALARFACRWTHTRERVHRVLEPLPPSHARSAALAATAAYNEPWITDEIVLYKSRLETSSVDELTGSLETPSVDELMLAMEGLIDNRQMRRTSDTTYIERRGTAWLGTETTPTWLYGNLVNPLTADPFPRVVEELRLRLNGLLHARYDCCLVNYYSDTDVGMKWHSDPDQEVNSLKPLFTTDTAVVSVGEPASLKFRPLKPSSSFSEDDRRFELFCCHGDVVRMHNKCQSVYEHAVEGTGQRFSLVFKETIRL